MRGRQRQKDDLHDAIRIAQNLVIPEAESVKALSGQPIIALFIVGIVRVLATIAFDNQSMAEANEVDYVGANRLLTPKLAVQGAENSPERNFSVCGIAAKRTG